jgi:transcriptional/translational regulatory protein YebC/TACO1
VAPDDLSSKARTFRDLGYEIQEAETIWLPLPESELHMEISSKEAKKLAKVIEELEEEEDITGVYSNMVFT